MRVNRIFADKLSDLIREDDIVWVHDYHLMPLGRELRARGHKNPIGFFLHIPCAPPDILQTLAVAQGDPRQPVLLRSRRLPDRQRSRQLRALSARAGRAGGPRRHLRDRRPAGAARRLSRRHRDGGLPAPRPQRGALAAGRPGSRRASTGTAWCSASIGSTIPRASRSASAPSRASSNTIPSGAAR